MYELNLVGVVEECFPVGLFGIEFDETFEEIIYSRIIISFECGAISFKVKRTHYKLVILVYGNEVPLKMERQFLRIYRFCKNDCLGI